MYMSNNCNITVYLVSVLFSPCHRSPVDSEACDSRAVGERRSWKKHRGNTASTGPQACWEKGTGDPLRFAVIMPEIVIYFHVFVLKNHVPA